ncbi:MAG: methylated-DNA--[protein]-cysteine S-methyltransferase [Eubacteriales bacterium]|nr:methylated-DNA--[protein]-cysteine S-methyltransferase [Eubacteriales bacterium]
MGQRKKENKTQSNRACVATPFGNMIIEECDGAVISLHAAEDSDSCLQECDLSQNETLAVAVREMTEYFNGTRKVFSFRMRLLGTTFQQNVWKALLRIPYGETRTYGEIALEIGNPKAARAVGGACNRNPIWIAVPCHRVLGSNGSMTGYAYGIGMKQQLLALENKNSLLQ